MVMIKVETLDRAFGDHLQLDDHSVVKTDNRGPIITVNSREVAWLFGVKMTTVEAWVAAGTLTPCSSTPGGNKRFWREDIAALLASYGA